MKTSLRPCWSILLAFATFLSLGMSAPAQAQIDTTGIIRVQPDLLFGIGISDVDIGTTTTGESVKISGGGGLGAGITLGYGLSPFVDIDAGLGYMKSELSPDVANADGSFDRTFVRLTVKYKIPVGDIYQFKFGAGIGFYRPGELDIDTSGVPGGNHLIVKYDNATGLHLTADWELFFQPRFSMVLGLLYSNVTYDWTSATVDGIPAVITAEDVKSLDGSAVDFCAALAFYF